MTTWLKRRIGETRQRLAKPFCKCFEDGNKSPVLLEMESSVACKCGEHVDVSEWKWESPNEADSTVVVIANDHKQVTFHPYYSAGTAMVRGNSPLVYDYHYYWEVKMLSEPYGTDIMVGLGTDKVDWVEFRYRFASLLGQNAESYGLSYTGATRHNDQITRDGIGFCQGSIIGVKVDLWHGTLEFYLNREPRGISFYNLKRHPNKSLYPMICSTAAQSTMRLIYASSWQASLLVDAAKILGASVNSDLALPPGLKNQMKTHFWLTFPNDGHSVDEKKKFLKLGVEPVESSENSDPNNYILPYPFQFSYNDYYTDNVSENYRVSILYADFDNMD